VVFVSIAVAYGVDPRYGLIAAVLLFLWPWIINQEGAPLAENPEYEFLPRI